MKSFPHVSFISKAQRQVIQQHLTREQMTEIRDFVTGKRQFLTQNIQLADVCRALVALTS